MIQVKKRDGSITEFDPKRVHDSIRNAFKAVYPNVEREAVDHICNTVAFEVRRLGKDPVGVEEIQDIIERVLWLSNFSAVGREYIIYRERHRTFRSLIDEYLTNGSWKIKENANSSYSVSALAHYLSGASAEAYWLERILPKKAKKYHEQGIIHLHDLGVLGPYCAGYALSKILMDGVRFSEKDPASAPPKHLSTVISQIINVVGILSQIQAGAIAFNHVSTLLAPYIRADNLSEKEVAQEIQQLIYHLNCPGRFGSQPAFTNLNLDFKVPAFMKKEPVLIAMQDTGTVYGDYEEEVRLFNMCFLREMRKGDASGRPFTFPITSIPVTSDLDWEDPVVNEVFNAATEIGLFNFDNFISTGRTLADSRSMCCHISLDITKDLQEMAEKHFGGQFGNADSTGSLSVTTINLNRIALMAKGNEEQFFAYLEKVANLCKSISEARRAFFDKQYENGLYSPMRYMLGKRGFQTFFSTIGVCGGHDACVNFFNDVAGISSDRGKQLMIKTLKFLKDKCKEFILATGHLYNLEATPAEGAAYRLALTDKKHFPDCYTTGNTENGSVPMLSSATLLPPFTTDLYTVTQHQSELQSLYNGGSCLHLYTNDKVNPQAFKSFMRDLFTRTKIPTITLTPILSSCPVHGVTVGEKSSCPTCGAECTNMARVVGYYRPYKSGGGVNELTGRIKDFSKGMWNDGRMRTIEQQYLYKAEEFEPALVDLVSA